MSNFKQTKINIADSDWECLNLLSKKEKIAVPDLIGGMIARSLEEYEDLQDSIWLQKSKEELKLEEGTPLEEVCRKLNISF